MDVETDVPFVGKRRLAGVDADPHAHGRRRERPLRCGRRQHGVASTPEDAEEGVALRVDLGTAVCGGRCAYEAPVLRQRFRIGRAERIEQSRRPLDVGEEERDGTAGQVHAVMIAPGYTGRVALTKDDVIEAMRQVEDPELGMDIVDLGLLYDVEIDGSKVKLIHSLTSMGCPAGPMIQEDMHRVASEVPGVENVEIELTWDPPWTPEKMSDDAKFILGFG
jgi:metal-sulfur cluster biosynthetic enzyme